MKSVFSFVFAFFFSTSVYSSTQVFKNFKAEYPNAKSLFKCATCHSQGTDLNAYGQDLHQFNLVFKDIEALDSDGDTFSNLDEITAGTLPGDENSAPGTQP